MPSPRCSCPDYPRDTQEGCLEHGYEIYLADTAPGDGYDEGPEDWEISDGPYQNQ